MIHTFQRGIFVFDLALDLRPGGVHSGHWGGLTTDPAIVLAHAIGSICDQRGKILVRDWLPRNGVPASVRAVLAGCPVGGGGEAATIDPDWGEPGLTPTERVNDCRDKKDNKYLELALAAGAATIVSGDTDLLDLDPWRGVRILRPADYVALIEAD